MTEITLCAAVADLNVEYLDVADFPFRSHHDFHSLSRHVDWFVEFQIKSARLLQRETKPKKTNQSSENNVP